MDNSTQYHLHALSLSDQYAAAAERAQADPSLENRIVAAEMSIAVLSAQFTTALSLLCELQAKVNRDG